MAQVTTKSLGSLGWAAACGHVNIQGPHPSLVSVLGRAGCTSPGQQSRAGFGGVGVGESQPESERAGEPVLPLVDTKCWIGQDCERLFSQKIHLGSGHLTPSEHQSKAVTAEPCPYWQMTHSSSAGSLTLWLLSILTNLHLLICKALGVNNHVRREQGPHLSALSNPEACPGQPADCCGWESGNICGLSGTPDQA